MGSQHTHTLLTSSLLAAFASLAQAWTPGIGHEADTSGFTVNTQSRNDVISFWHSVYRQSEGYEDRINWTGSIGSGNPGTTSAAFKDDIERRINYYRAMAGMNANIFVSPSSLTISDNSGHNAPAGTTKQTAAQAAAFMLSCNSDEFRTGGGVATGAHSPHDPPASWIFDSQTARNGAYFSNLAVGHYGPGAIDAYMRENDRTGASVKNSKVAHRRWILYSRRKEVSTGDVTLTPSGTAPYYAANALYVIGDLLPPPADNTFIAWPSAGFFPEPILPEPWSLSYPGADFGPATVSITNAAGTPVATTVLSRNASYGDNTLVWKLDTPPPSAATEDQTYHVTVSNIFVGGSPRSHSYSVTIINPNRLLQATNLNGSDNPPDTGARYFFTPVDKAVEYEFNVTRQTAATWIESAEDDTAANITDNTASNYDLRASHSWPTNYGGNYFTSGKSFRLAFPDNVTVPEQSFIINRNILPHNGATVNYSLRRGYMQSSTNLAIQSSTDGGASWTTLASHSGNASGEPDNRFSNLTTSIPESSNTVLIRFLFFRNAGAAVYDVTTYPGYPMGIFIDNISFTNCDELVSLGQTTVPSSADYATLDATSAGGPLVAGQGYIIRARARIGNHWFPYSIPRKVTPVAANTLSPYELWFRGHYPTIGGFNDDYDQDGIDNGLERIFGSNPMDSTDAASPLAATLTGNYLEISRTVIPGTSVEAEYSHTLAPGSWHPATVTITGNTATAKAPASPKGCYIRWKTATP